MQNGPVAVPLIEKLFLLVVLVFDGREGREEPTMLNWEERLGEELEVVRALRRRSEWLWVKERGPRGAAGRGFEEEEEEGGLLRVCRSCVHSAFTFPGEGRGEERAEEFDLCFYC
jgi:hypothetical protein